MPLCPLGFEGLWFNPWKLNDAVPPSFVKEFGSATGSGVECWHVQSVFLFK